MCEKEIECQVLRIKKMEMLFDLVTKTLHSRTDELQSASIREAVQTLSDYYGNGDWLQDYELDEQRMLPPDLKRGVLSQDGLYDLLSGIKDVTAK